MNSKPKHKFYRSDISFYSKFKYRDFKLLRFYNASLIYINYSSFSLKLFWDKLSYNSYKLESYYNPLPNYSKFYKF